MIVLYRSFISNYGYHLNKAWRKSGNQGPVVQNRDQR